MTTPRRTCFVILDADNITADRTAVVEAVASDSSARGGISLVYVVGKHSSPRDHYAALFRDRNPEAVIRIERAPAGKDRADAICAFLLGVVTQRALSEECASTVYVLTHDRLILCAAKKSAEYGLNIAVLSTVPAAHFDGPQRLTIVVEPSPGYRPHRQEHDQQANDEPQLPAWAIPGAPCTNPIGLTCLAVNSSQPHPAPSFVPFPASQAVVTLGSRGKLDIELYHWEVGRSAGRRGGRLYSPHVEFLYSPWPLSSWTIRSTHGFRRGAKRVVVDGKLIDASYGFVPIDTGTQIEIGNFCFTFSASALLQVEWFEDPKQIVQLVETRLNAAVSNLPLDSYPEPVTEELTVQGVLSLHHAYLRHYSEIILGNWNVLTCQWPACLFQSKSDFKRTMGSLNQLRNVAMHPSRPPLSPDQRRRLAEIFVRLQLNRQPTSHVESHSPVS